MLMRACVRDETKHSNFLVMEPTGPGFEFQSALLLFGIIHYEDFFLFPGRCSIFGGYDSPLARNDEQINKLKVIQQTAQAGRQAGAQLLWVTLAIPSTLAVKHQHGKKQQTAGSERRPFSSPDLRTRPGLQRYRLANIHKKSANCRLQITNRKKKK